MISLNQFNIKRVNEKADSATFEIGPLPKGYGHTLGNFLRRVLLSSIPGSAITAVKIDGVEHEYSTLEGLSDDILTIILSIKNVVVVSKSLEPEMLNIDIKGKDGKVVEVTAGDIEKNSNVEVINPDYVITRLTGTKGRFKAQLKVERGTGYTSAKEESRKELGMLPIDVTFSTVKLVNYEIVPTRVGQETELDQLNLTVHTNGAVTPIEALHVAVDSLDQMTNHLKNLSEQMLSGNEVTVMLNKEEKKNMTNPISSTSDNKPPLKVVDMNLSTRLTNALIRAGFDDLRKLEGLTEEEVANIRGMGSKSITELLDTVKKHNIKLI